MFAMMGSLVGLLVLLLFHIRNGSHFIMMYIYRISADYNYKLQL